MNQVLVAIFVSVALLSQVSWLGCSKPNASTGSVKDSTSTFREVMENQHASGLNKREYAGKLIFIKYCQVCHGAEGDGKGFNAFNLQNSFGMLPANFTDSTTVAALTEKTIIAAVSKGGNAVGKSQYMPPWGGTLRTEEVENVAAYIKALARLKREKESPK